MTEDEPRWALYGPVEDQHHAAETAHIAARLSWLWPDDHQRRLDAIDAWGEVGMDYLGVVEQFIHGTGGTATNAQAQKWTADHMRGIADTILSVMDEVDAIVAPDRIPEWMDTSPGKDL